MIIESIPVTLRILKPTAEGNWLTNGETYSQEVYLGKEDSRDNWREVTAVEYEAAMAKAEGDING